MFNDRRTSTTRTQSESTDRLRFVVSLTLLLRLATVLYAFVNFAPEWFFSRGSEMGLLANSVLRGTGLSSPFGPPTGPTAMVAPGYPLLVSVVFRVLGSSSVGSAFCLMALNVVCNCVTVGFIYRLAQELATERMAFVAALFWACSLPLVWMPTIFWETSFSTLLLTGIVYSLLSITSARPLRFWFFSGGVFGGAGLLNPALLLSIAVMAGYTILRTAISPTRVRSIAVCLAGFAFVFSPWPLRNAHVFHALVLTRTTVGLELWMGNHPGSTGFLEPSRFPTYSNVELTDYRRRGELGYMAKKSELAQSYIRSHPMAFLKLSARRIVRFWTGTGTWQGSILFGIHATVTSLLGCWGLYLLWRSGHRKACLTMLLPMLLFPLPYYITHAEFRYRIVLDPLLTALGGRALDAVAVHLRPARKRPLRTLLAHPS